MSDLPESYTCNSNKEELCLEFVRHFNANYERLYPERKPLFLICPNEYGVDKFVCTTVRPTLLPFREVYDIEKTAEFVSNYLDYEPLELPTEPPSCLPSPAQVRVGTVWACRAVASKGCQGGAGGGHSTTHPTHPTHPLPRRRTLTLLSTTSQTPATPSPKPTPLCSTPPHPIPHRTASLCSRLAPTLPPFLPPSPQVIGWCVGDSYDFAVLLTSFLLGAGYDAFVVSGTAPRWVTLRDMSRSKCPLMVAEAVAQEAKDAEIAAQPAEEKPSKYMINPRGVPSSKFQAMEEAKRRAAAAKPTQEWVSDDDSEDGGEKKEGGPEVAESKYDSDADNMGFTG